jgi:endonuclease YncB( thermonuclease family)
MSMHWNPGKSTVDLNAGAAKARPSIRRAPVPTAAKPRVRRSDEAETWMGVAGISAIAAILVAAIGAAAYVTYSKGSPADTAAMARFGQCYAAQGPNCVVDGDTIQMGRETIQIAALDTPRIEGYRCESERTAGIAAAVGLAQMLNTGRVTVGEAFRDGGGRTVRKVMVNGQEVRDTMIERGLGRRYNPDSSKGWC